MCARNETAWALRTRPPVRAGIPPFPPSVAIRRNFARWWSSSFRLRDPLLLRMCEGGDVAEGLLRLSRCLETAPVDDVDLQRVIRASWLRYPRHWRYENTRHD